MEFNSIECISSSSEVIDDEDQIRYLLHPQYLPSKPHNSSAIHPTTSVHELLECPVCTNSMYPPIHQSSLCNSLEKHDDLKAERVKRKSLEKQLEVEKKKTQKSESDLLNARMEVEGVQIKLRDMEKEEEKKLKADDLKGYQEGYNRAAAQYFRDARRMVNMELEKRLGPFYLKAFKARIEAHVGRYQANVNDTILAELIPEPLPEFPLPYTAEEGEPLPSDDEEAEEGECEAADGREQIVDVDGTGHVEDLKQPEAGQADGRKYKANE